MDDGRSSDGGSDDPDVYYGTRYRVVLCRGARKSLKKALKGDRKAASALAELEAQIQRLVDGRRLPASEFPVEGRTPACPGADRGSYHAFKRIPLRAYCWCSPSRADTWYISHFVKKTWTKRKKDDEKRLHGNWNRIEIDGEER